MPGISISTFWAINFSGKTAYINKIPLIVFIGDQIYGKQPALTA
jgi:hypothetical protein